MARTNVYLPDELAAMVRAELPDLNLSQVMQRALVALLECEHPRLACADCSAELDRRSIVEAPLDALWRHAMDELELLVLRGGTAEGAARVLRRVGEAHRVSAATRRPLPRPTRHERRSRQVRDLFDDRKATA